MNYIKKYNEFNQINEGFWSKSMLLLTLLTTLGTGLKNANAEIDNKKTTY